MQTDRCLRSEVERELEWEADVPSFEIGVAVKEGIVTLMGMVAGHAAKRAAERAATRVEGVKAVSNQLTVKISGLAEPSDADIAWAAANVLAWDDLAPAKRIRISVSRGWITLDGTVDWHYQRTAAERAVSKLAGVAGVLNAIAVQREVPVDAIQEHIESALKQNAEVDTRNIIVEANEACVKLWGSVESCSQREAAAQTAWLVPGVQDVSNHITVEAPAGA